MKKVVTCLEIPINLSEIATISPVKDTLIRDPSFTVVLSSGKEIKFKHYDLFRVQNEREELLKQWIKYQNS